MMAPDFWYRRFSLRSMALAPLGLAYGAISGQRMQRAGKRPPLPVVCIGNFVVGGAGKTPTALAVGRIAREAGLNPCFLLRGYRGRLRGPLLVDPEKHGAADVGDEALLLASLLPTVVSSNRQKALPLISGLGHDICLMDDGFQNPSIQKTLSLVVVDGAVGVGTGLPLPAGPLRAPMSVQWPRTDALVLLGQGPSSAPLVRQMARLGRPVLRADLVSTGLESLSGQSVLAYCGIGRPAKFFRSVSNAGAKLVGTRSFADHHVFTGLEAAELLRDADALGARLVTTAKDAMRLAHAGPGPRAELLAATSVADVVCRFDSPDFVASLLLAARDNWLHEL